MTEKLFETALGLSTPWYVAGVEFDGQARKLTIRVDFTSGSRFSVRGVQGAHPVYDTVSKRYRHLNFFQYECQLEVRVPRVKLPDGAVRQVEPPWAGKLSGFTLLFEALVLLLCQQMPFRGVARLVNLSPYQAQAICRVYVDLAVAQGDYSEVRQLAIDETSQARGHDYVTLAADAARRAVIFVSEGRDAQTIAALAQDLTAHGGDPKAIEGTSIDMSPAFIKGVSEHLPNAQITFDKFHVVAHASAAIDKTRRIEQKMRSQPQGAALEAVEGSPRPQCRAPCRTRCPARPIDHQAHRAGMAVPRTIARDSRPQTDQRRTHPTSAMVHERAALQGRADEGGRPHDPQPSRRHHRLGANAPDQRLPGSDQRIVPSGQTQSAWLRSVLHHSYRHLPACR